MKRFLLWSFERGSTQYDVICALIVAFIFLTPAAAFNDRPDFMRIDRAETVRQTRDDNGNTVYTVKIDAGWFSGDDAGWKAAEDRLEQAVGPFKVLKKAPIVDFLGRTRAYAIWIEK